MHAEEVKSQGGKPEFGGVSGEKSRGFPYGVQFSEVVKAPGRLHRGRWKPKRRLSSEETKILGKAVLRSCRSVNPGPGQQWGNVPGVFLRGTGPRGGLVPCVS